MNLIEKLQARRDQFNGFSRHEVFDKNDLADAVQTCIDIVERHSEWISVDERLPDDGVYVLVYEPRSGLQYIAMRTKWEDTKDDFFYLWEFLDLDGYLSDEEVTHWHSLPQPPSEVQDD